MVTERVRFGLTLANRGVTFGATTPAQMLEMAEIADRSGLYESVWVGDSLLGKPRMESVTLLAGVAARTTRVRLGPACMASFPLRDPVQLAYQWASLDLLSEGRTVLIVCTGIGQLEGHHAEARLYNLTPRDRVRRMIEGIKVLKRLWTEERVSFEGEYYRFEDITVAPRPARQPRPPIWIANSARGDDKLVVRTHRRVARHADGWQTAIASPDEFAQRRESISNQARLLERDPAELENCLYHNINVNEDRQAAYDESKRFLDIYYATDWDRATLEKWVTYGSPQECIEKLRRYAAAGPQEISLRCTAWDQMGQLRRCLEEVLPFV